MKVLARSKKIASEPRRDRPPAAPHHSNFNFVSRCKDAFNGLKASVVKTASFSKTKRSKRARADRPRRPGVPRHGDFPRISHFSEAFNTLRTNLRFAKVGGPARVLLITGAAPREGKTTVAVNLAESCAFAGQKTLLIEGDLRLASFKYLFSSKQKKGLSTLVCETLDTPVDKGALGSVTLGDLISLVELKEETGVLTITSNSDAYQFSFEMGRLVSSAWKKRPKDKQLIVSLIRNGMLTEDQGRAALTRASRTGQQLPFLLLNMRAVTPEQLKGPIHLQIMDALGHALNVRQAEYSFRQKSHVPYPRGIVEPIGLGNGLDDELPGLRLRPFLKKQIASSIIETGTKNLHILPAGPTPPNPSEVLGSPRMAALMSMLRDMFDYDILIIDSPPITSVSDAAVLSVFADGVVLVACAGTINRTMIRKAVEQLTQVNAPLLGFVLNRMDPKEERRYYSYYYRYRYHDYYYTGKRRKEDTAET